MKSKYVNLFTDFGFKKIFGEEANKPLLIDFEERGNYEERLKTYRDYKGVIDTAFDDGIIKGISKVAKKMKDDGEPTDKIIQFTGLTKEIIDSL